MKKSMKRTLSLLLALTMVLSLGLPAYAVGTTAGEPESLIESPSVMPKEGITDGDPIPVEVPEQPVDPIVNTEDQPQPVFSGKLDEIPVEGEIISVDAPVDVTTEEEDVLPVEIDPQHDFHFADESGFVVDVHAPFGALPEGTEMRVTRLADLTAVQRAVENANMEGNVQLAADISFWLNGEEIEPNAGAKLVVSMSAPVIAGLADPVVVHIPDGANTVPEIVAQISSGDVAMTDTVSFETSSFSVYAVVGEGDQGDYARVEVNFFNGTTKIATMYVKNKDRKDDDTLALVLYDPGAGTIPAGQMFKGWTTKQNYTVADVNSAMTIDDVRTAIKGTTITEGMDPINYYAMIFSVYNVTYLDELGVKIKTDTVYAKAGESYQDYEVSQPYTPRDPEANFEGWQKLNAAGNPVGDTIAIGDKLDLTESITLKAYVPKGAWVEFRENGENASYTAPQFIHKGNKATEPDDPSRTGYIFGGWYKDAACTDGPFDFNTTINGRTVLYAKWTPIATANYNVIIWLQNVDLNGYDFKEAVQLSGSTSGTANVSANGSGDNRYAVVGGTNKRYTGFHLDHFDENVAIKPEGNTVVNVYYDRNEYTLTFQVDKSGPWSWSSDWQTVKTITAKYGTVISNQFPISGYDNYMWESQGGQTFGDRWIIIADVMPAEDVTFHGENGGTAFRMRYWVQPTSLSTNFADYELVNTITSYSSSFSLTYEEDFMEMSGFVRVASNPAFSSYDKDGIIEHQGYGTMTVDFYYNRDVRSINFYDGEYVSGKDESLYNKADQHLKTVTNIAYGSDITSYNKGGSNYVTDVNPFKDGFVFEGWYLDSTCTHEVNFTTMPKQDLKVYAKWRQVEYRVFLHPNVPANEPNFSMGGQATSFRVAYNGQIRDGGDILATRDEFDLIGWYFDEDCTQLFNSSVYYFNDSNTVEYKKTEDTETDVYGNPTEEGNKDSNRHWITRKLDLYAKWRSKLIGANGITVVFDAGDGKHADGTTEWTDPSQYLDQATGTGAAASTPNDSTKVFKYWVLYTYNQTSGEFVATETHVNPGESFDVLKRDAKAEDIPGVPHEDGKIFMKYTVKLVAVYGKPEDETPTHITWNSNIYDAAGNTIPNLSTKLTDTKPAAVNGKEYERAANADGSVSYTIKDIALNQAIDIPTPYAIEGYKFLGWGRVDTGSPTRDPSGITDPANLSDETLFLKYVETKDGNAHYEAEISGSWTTVTQVAADEENPYQDLYAIWTAEFYVVYSGRTNAATTAKETYYITKANNSFNLLASHKQSETNILAVETLESSPLTAGYLYGGYYTEATPAAAPYDGTNWTFDYKSAGTVDAAAIHPVAGTIYYVKEVPGSDYLTPKLAYTYFKNTKLDFYSMGSVYLISFVDDAVGEGKAYKETGFFINNEQNACDGAIESLEIYARDGKPDEKMYFNPKAGGKGQVSYFCALYRESRDADPQVKLESNQVVSQYWITNDNYLVYGFTSRSYNDVDSHGTQNSPNGTVITVGTVNTAEKLQMVNLNENS